MLGFYTIPEGQRIALWDDRGRRTIMDGPQGFGLRGRRVEPLKPFVAGPSQYLIVKHRDGRIVHKRGPAVFWKDPVEHLEIGVENAITLDANEALVVYRQEAEGKVQRRIVRGPEMFVP